MQASKFGYLLVAGVIATLPACFTVDKGSDDDSGGQSGDTGSGGSTSGTSGKGGGTSGSSGSSSGTSGSSSGTSGSSSGTSGSSSGTSGTSGTSGSSAGGSDAGTSGTDGGGTSGTGTTGTCDTTSYALPVVECPAGYVSMLSNDYCYDFFACLVNYSCSTAGDQCRACFDASAASLTDPESACLQDATDAQLQAACEYVASETGIPECAP